MNLTAGKALLIGIPLALLIGVVALSYDPEGAPQRRLERQQQRAQQRARETISEDVKATIYAEIRSTSPLVRDVFIRQKGKDLTVAVAVNPIITDDYAKTLAESAVRLTRSLSQDQNPGRSVGKGIYNYHVGVASYLNPNEFFAQGYKHADSVNITW